MIDHFGQVSDAVRLPIIVDDDPGRTAKDYGYALLDGLAAFDTIEGVCHGFDRIAYFAGLPGHLRSRFLHLSKDDRTLQSFLNLRGSGAISPLANIMPSAVEALVSMAYDFRGTAPLAHRLADLSSTIGTEDVAAVKEAASYLYHFSPSVRLPLVGTDPDMVRHIHLALAPFAHRGAPSHAA